MINSNDINIEIRPITENDINSVLNIYKQCEDFLALGPVPTASYSMIEADIENSKIEHGLYCGIFTDKNIMIGIVDYIQNNYLDEPNHAYLSLLMIAKPYRNKGIGSIIVNKIELEIKKNPDIKCIYSGVQINNIHAIEFWNKMGYKIYSGPELLPDKTTVFHLIKIL